MAYSYYREAKLTGGWHTARLAFQINSQDIATNKSNVTLKLQVREDVNAASYNLTGSAMLWIKINGVIKASKTTFDWRNYVTGTWYNELTWTGDLTHNADGTLSITLDGYIETGVGAGDYNPTDQTVVLTTIPRTSVLGTPVFATLEKAFTVPITKYSTTFYDVLTATIGSTLIKTVNGYTNNASVIFTDSELLAAYNALNDDMTPAVVIGLKTYSSSAKTTLIGTATSKTAAPAIGGTMKRNINGIWKNCLVYRNINGTWKRCIAFRNINGTWKKGD